MAGENKNLKVSKGVHGRVKRHIDKRCAGMKLEAWVERALEAKIATEEKEALQPNLPLHQ